MPKTRTAGTAGTIWYKTGFAFPSGDRCQCHRRRTRNGNKKRCGNHDCAVMLTHPETGVNKLYCLDCWARYRDEKTTPGPAQVRTYKQMRREGMTPMAIGC